MPLKFWWPTAMALQVILIQNFLKKIGGYAASEFIGGTDRGSRSAV
jgi:hypothetical protein